VIDSWSKFYYSFQVDATNQYLSFDEGSGEVVATIRRGKYAPTQGLLEVASQMNNVGGLTYTVSMNRATRKVTISSTSNFTLKVNSGSTFASSIFALLGFTGADRTGASSYTGNLQIAKEYAVQFKVQDYIAPEHYKKSVDTTIKKAADGTVEVVTFGLERYIQLNIKYVTNKASDGQVIRYNANGVEDLVEFLDWLITKAPCEFIPDEDDPASYFTVLLDKTPDGQTGTDYILKELYAQNLAGYFESGRLIFRVVE
jgi:hypothetical protein